MLVQRQRVAMGFEQEPGSAGVARRFVGDVLRSWRLHDLAGDALLCSSELVANAVEHACGPIELSLEPTVLGVRISVHDGSPVMPTARALDVMEDAGRGLMLVAALSSAWGVETAPPGKVVWCELAEHDLSRRRARWYGGDSAR